MRNQSYIHTGCASIATATRWATPALGRVWMGVAVKHDANRSSLAERRKT